MSGLADLPSAFEQSLGRLSLPVEPMGFRHMFGVGGVGSAFARSWVDGDALRLVKDFDPGGGEPKVEVAIDQLVGSAVIVAVCLQMVVGRKPAWREPLGIFVGSDRQWFACQPV
jgi:hypothetical protein